MINGKSKFRLIAICLASLTISSLIAYINHSMKGTRFYYGTEVIVPDKYINDNFYEIARIHAEHKNFDNFRQLQYDQMSRIVKFELRKKFGELDVNIDGANGVVKVGAKGNSPEEAKELGDKVIHFLLKYWIKHISDVKQPLHTLKKELAHSAELTQRAIENNDKIIKSKKVNSILYGYALEKSIELSRLKAELNSKLTLINGILKKTRTPFISPHRYEKRAYKPSIIKSLAIFTLVFFVCTSVMIHFFYIRTNKTKSFAN